MASRYFSEEDLICPVCRDIFRHPVLLSCNHSVCRNCIETFWESQASKECPVCRRRSSKDFALNNQCETFLEERRQRSSSGTCSAHKEKLKLFCLDDQKLMCVVCRDSRKHTNHRVCPIDEAAVDNKEILKAALKALQKKLRTFENGNQSFSETAEKIKIKAEQTERQIKAEFEELHQLLRDEEAARLTALREEEKQKVQMTIEKIENMSRQISSLRQTIRDITERMNAPLCLLFLQNVKSTLQRAQCNLLVPEPSPAATINFSNHPTNLKLTVLQKMQENVGKTAHFNTDHSDFHAAMETLNNPVKCTEYKPFPKGQGNSTKLFRDKQSRKGSQPVSWEVHASSKTPNPVRTVQLSYDRHQFPKQHPQYKTTENLPCSQTNHPTPHKRNIKNNPGNAEDQNPDMQFPGVKDLVKKINEQMKM